MREEFTFFKRRYSIQDMETDLREQLNNFPNEVTSLDIVYYSNKMMAGWVVVYIDDENERRKI